MIKFEFAFYSQIARLVQSFYVTCNKYLQMTFWFMCKSNASVKYCLYTLEKKENGQVVKIYRFVHEIKSHA